MVVKLMERELYATPQALGISILGFIYLLQNLPT